MVQVETRSARHGSPGPGSARHHSQLMNSIKRPHKVVLEEVTQQKKKLITVVSASCQDR